MRQPLTLSPCHLCRGRALVLCLHDARAPLPEPVHGPVQECPPMPGKACLSPPVTMYDAADYRLLLGLQREAMHYFLDNQTPAGLVLDRQSNHGPPRRQQPCSLAATGMGFIAMALATAPPYRLLGRPSA